MMIKKMLLLASMALAAIAFAAPAAQAELFWSNTGTFEVTGEIGSEGSGLVTGPGEVHIHGNLFNGPTMGEGTIDNVEVTGVLTTNLPGCHAVATATATAETPWPITLTTEDTIDIGDATDPVTFINHYTTSAGPGCPNFKVPATVPAEGVVTGTITNEGGNACIDLNNHDDDMINELSGGAVDLFNPEGEPLCIEGVEVE